MRYLFDSMYQAITGLSHGHQITWFMLRVVKFSTTENEKLLEGEKVANKMPNCELMYAQQVVHLLTVRQRI